jgi:uncharacterized membrane protein
MVRARITIDRPVDEVFGFYADFANLPSFVGDVVAVEQVGPSVMRWIIDGPLGFPVHMFVKLTEFKRGKLIRYQSCNRRGLNAKWRLEFRSRGPCVTEVEEQLSIPLGVVGRLGLALAGKFPGAEVRANLLRLKGLLEQGDPSSVE